MLADNCYGRFPIAHFFYLCSTFRVSAERDCMQALPARSAEIRGVQYKQMRSAIGNCLHFAESFGNGASVTPFIRAHYVCMQALPARSAEIRGVQRKWR